MKKVIGILCCLLSLHCYAEGMERKIAVMGSSECEIMPDIAKIRFEVTEKNRNPEEAKNKINKKLEKLYAELQREKIEYEKEKTLSYDSRKIQEENSEEKKHSYVAKLDFSISGVAPMEVEKMIEEQKGISFGGIQKNYEKNTFDFSIEEIGKTGEEAVRKAIQRFQALPKNVGNLTLQQYRVFSQNGIGKQEEIYQVSQILSLQLKKASQMNTFLTIADEVGIQVNHVDFDLSNREEVESKMYEKALGQAKNKASNILKLSSLRLSDPMVISEEQYFQEQIPQAMMLADSYGAGASKLSKRVAENEIDYRPKALSLSQQISVIYEMQNAVNSNSKKNFEKKIQVTGTSFETVKPDLVRIPLEIRTQEKSLQEASERNAALFKKYQEELRNQKLSFEKISSLEYTTYPQEIFRENGNKKIYQRELIIELVRLSLEEIEKIVPVFVKEGIQTLQRNQEGSYSFSILSEDKNMQIAKDRANDTLQKLQSQIDNLQVVGFQNREKNMAEEGKKEREYVVVHTIEVESRDLTKIGNLLDTAYTLGIEGRGNLYYDIDHKQEIEGHLYQKAYEEAMKKANSMIKNTNLVLKAPFYIKDASTDVVRAFPSYYSKEEASVVVPEEQRVSKKIYVEFEIEKKK